MPRSKSEYHSASEALFRAAKDYEALTAILSAHELTMAAPGNWDSPDAYEGIADYGAVVIRARRRPSESLLSFGLGWTLEGGREIHFVVRWRPDVMLTEVETSGFLDFAALLRAVVQEVRRAT